MKKTQKMVLFMAVLVMAIGGLNAEYILRFSSDVDDTYCSLVEWYVNEIFQGVYDMPCEFRANSAEELYGVYIVPEIPLAFPYLGHFEMGGDCDCNTTIDGSTIWDSDGDDHIKEFGFVWIEDNVAFLVVVNAWDTSTWPATPYPVYVTGPNENSSGTTNYSLFSENLDDVLGTYTPAKTGDINKGWYPPYITLDLVSGWQEAESTKGTKYRSWEIHLDFNLDYLSNWPIIAIDGQTGEPIQGATLWQDSDCEGEGEPRSIGVTDEDGIIIVLRAPEKSGDNRENRENYAPYLGSGCYYLTHPSYIAWTPDHVYQSGWNLPYPCSYTEFYGFKATPVELSSFTATISALNNVALTWVTETETGMRGYYVHRAEINNLTNAQTVSPLIASSNSSQQHTYHYEDAELQDSGTYYYWLEASDLDGSTSFHGPVSVLFNAAGENSTPEIPLLTQLHSVYPNPFNPMAFIPFSLAKDSAVNIKIYNSRGQMVKHFELGAKAAGMHRISWDGTDYNGKILSNGVYNIVMNAGKDSYQTKAVLLK